jgi:acyl-CoA thioesterase FadM
VGYELVHIANYYTWFRKGGEDYLNVVDEFQFYDWEARNGVLIIQLTMIVIECRLGFYLN